MKYCFKFIRGIDDASWSGSIYNESANVRYDSVGHFLLSCFEDSCVGTINLWTNGDKYVIKPMKQKNGGNRIASLMKVIIIKVYYASSVFYYALLLITTFPTATDE